MGRCCAREFPDWTKCGNPDTLSWHHIIRGVSGVIVEAQAKKEKPARKQQQRSLKTKQKLLDAAIEAFSENGFKGTSTRDIADRAGVHHPLITYHFKNKEALWRAAADRIFSRFNANMSNALQECLNESPRTRMANMIRTYVHYAASQPALHKVMVQEASTPSPRLDWLIENHLRPLFDVSVKNLKEMQDQGLAPPGNVAILFNLIRVSAGGLIALGHELKGTSGIDLDAPGTIDELADMIVDVFLPLNADDTSGGEKDQDSAISP
jgi:TetR/AcrR family transcriptional regulator